MRKQSIGLRKLLAILLALGMVAAACGGTDEPSETTQATDGTPTTTDSNTPVTEPPDDETPQFGGEIAVGLEADAEGLRPWEDTGSSPAYNMFAAIYDKLMEQNPAGEFVPFLAESLESEDLITWTLKLREGVELHNGKPVNADTLVGMFGVQQTGAQSAGFIGLSGLESVEKVDDLTVNYILARPFAAMPSILSRAQLGMVFDPEEAAADPEAYGNTPIGSGPFMIESRDVNNETVVVRNPNYWLTSPEGEQLPYLDKISFRPIPIEGTRLDSLASDTVQVMQTLRGATVRDARALGDEITRYEFQGSNTGGGMFNVLVPPYDDVRVRKGLLLLNSVPAVIDALGGTGIVEPATQFFAPDSPWWSEKVAAAYPTQDREAGVALLQAYVDDPARSDGKAAGEIISVSLASPPDPTLIAAQEVIKQLWDGSELVETELVQYPDQPTHIGVALGRDNGFVGNHTVHFWRWSDEDDPALNLNGEFLAPTPEIAAAAGVPFSPVNWSNYFNPEMFGLLVQASSIADFETRKGFYEQVGLILAEEVPIFFTSQTATMVGTANNVRGINSWHTPDGGLGIGIPNAEVRYHEVWLVS